jgi:branched-subunit amino acid aminotransferase/4-amino-4-deoxychorismate lyase
MRVEVTQGGTWGAKARAPDFVDHEHVAALLGEVFHGVPRGDPPSPGMADGKIYMDTRSTSTSIFTTHKTTYRKPYDEARARRGVVASDNAYPDEVLMYNPDGYVTEGSISTVYFWRDGRWVTPAKECGGNLGVKRQEALEKGFCAEGMVKKESVEGGEIVWLSNAVRGFWMAEVVL